MGILYYFVDDKTLKQMKLFSKKKPKQKESDENTGTNAPRGNEAKRKRWSE